MTQYDKDILMKLDTDQLVFLIEKMKYSLDLIGIVCVEESKWHIEAGDAVAKIREYIYHMPSLYDITETRAEIDLDMGKISPAEYRKIKGFE